MHADLTKDGTRMKTDRISQSRIVDTTEFQKKPYTYKQILRRLSVFHDNPIKSANLLYELLSQTSETRDNLKSYEVSTLKLLSKFWELQIVIKDSLRQTAEQHKHLLTGLIQSRDRLAQRVKHNKQAEPKLLAQLEKLNAKITKEQKGNTALFEKKLGIQLQKVEKEITRLIVAGSFESEEVSETLKYAVSKLERISAITYKLQQREILEGYSTEALLKSRAKIEQLMSDFLGITEDKQTARLEDLFEPTQLKDQQLQDETHDELHLGLQTLRENTSGAQTKRQLYQNTLGAQLTTEAALMKVEHFLDHQSKTAIQQYGVEVGTEKQQKYDSRLAVLSAFQAALTRYGVQVPLTSEGFAFHHDRIVQNELIQAWTTPQKVKTFEKFSARYAHAAAVTKKYLKEGVFTFTEALDLSGKLGELGLETAVVAGVILFVLSVRLEGGHHGEGHNGDNHDSHHGFSLMSEASAQEATKPITPVGTYLPEYKSITGEIDFNDPASIDGAAGKLRTYLDSLRTDFEQNKNIPRAQLLNPDKFPEYYRAWVSWSYLKNYKPQRQDSGLSFGTKSGSPLKTQFDLGTSETKAPQEKSPVASKADSLKNIFGKLDKAYSEKEVEEFGTNLKNYFTGPDSLNHRLFFQHTSDVSKGDKRLSGFIEYLKANNYDYTKIHLNDESSVAFKSLIDAEQFVAKNALDFKEQNLNNQREGTFRAFKINKTIVYAAKLSNGLWKVQFVENNEIKLEQIKGKEELKEFETRIKHPDQTIQTTEDINIGKLFANGSGGTIYKDIEITERSKTDNEESIKKAIDELGIGVNLKTGAIYSDSDSTNIFDWSWTFTKYPDKKYSLKKGGAGYLFVADGFFNGDAFIMRILPKAMIGGHQFEIRIDKATHKIDIIPEIYGQPSDEVFNIADDKSSESSPIQRGDESKDPGELHNKTANTFTTEVGQKLKEEGKNYRVTDPDVRLAIADDGRFRLDWNAQIMEATSRDDADWMFEQQGTLWSDTSKTKADSVATKMTDEKSKKMKEQGWKQVGKRVIVQKQGPDGKWWSLVTDFFTKSKSAVEQQQATMERTELSEEQKLEQELFKEARYRLKLTKRVVSLWNQGEGSGKPGSVGFSDWTPPDSAQFYIILDEENPDFPNSEIKLRKYFKLKGDGFVLSSPKDGVLKIQAFNKTSEAKTIHLINIATGEIEQQTTTPDTSIKQKNSVSLSELGKQSLGSTAELTKKVAEKAREHLSERQAQSKISPIEQSVQKILDAQHISVKENGLLVGKGANAKSFPFNFPPNTASINVSYSKDTKIIYIDALDSEKKNIGIRRFDVSKKQWADETQVKVETKFDVRNIEYWNYSGKLNPDLSNSDIDSIKTAMKKAQVEITSNGELKLGKTSFVENLNKRGYVSSIKISYDDMLSTLIIEVKMQDGSGFEKVISDEGTKIREETINN